MNIISRNQVNAIRSTTTVCDGSSAITAPIIAFAPVLTLVKNKIVLIDQYDQLVQYGTSGVTLDTVALRNVMTNIAFRCANAVYAYADSVGNFVLANTVDRPISYFERLAKEEIGVFAQTIYDGANSNILIVVNFGITASDVSDLLSAITLYNIGIQNPRQAIIAKSNAIKQIKLLIRNVFDVQFAKQMDRMVNTLSTSAPEFVSNYFKAREIIDLGKIHTKIKGTTKDDNANSLVGVSVKLMNPGTKVPAYTIKSLTNGIIPNTYVLPGNYDILVELPGFNSVSEPAVRFSPGKTVKRNFILTPVIV